MRHSKHHRGGKPVIICHKKVNSKPWTPSPYFFSLTSKNVNDYKDIIMTNLLENPHDISQVKKLIKHKFFYKNPTFLANFLTFQDQGMSHPQDADIFFSDEDE